MSVLTALPQGVPLAAMPLNDDTVSPGFLGFGVFLVLLVALVFLIRSMNKRIRGIKAPSEADLKQQEWERAQDAPEGSEEPAEKAANGARGKSPEGNDPSHGS